MNSAADTLAMDSSFPLARDSLGCNPSRVRGYPLLKCSDQLDTAAPAALVQGKMGQLRAHHLHSSLRELVSLPREGLQALLPNLSIQQQGQEREGWEKQLFQGLSKSKKHREIRKWLFPVSAGSWTIAPMEVSAWGATRHENGEEMLSLEPETTWNGFKGGNCQLGIGNFLNDPNYTARQYLTNVKAI